MHPLIAHLSALVLAAVTVTSDSVRAEEQTLRISSIPDESPTELQRKFTPLANYLEAATGMKVVYTPVTDYAAVVEALAAKKIDLAWLGGFTFVGLTGDGPRYSPLALAPRRWDNLHRPCAHHLA